jgi:hypothetical protein
VRTPTPSRVLSRHALPVTLLIASFACSKVDSPPQQAPLRWDKLGWGSSPEDITKVLAERHLQIVSRSTNAKKEPLWQLGAASLEGVPFKPVLRFATGSLASVGLVCQAQPPTLTHYYALKAALTTQLGAPSNASELEGTTTSTSIRWCKWESSSTITTLAFSGDASANQNSILLTHEDSTRQGSSETDAARVFLPAGL